MKYRPRLLDDVLGNDSVIESLKSIFQRDTKDIPHAFLFTGPSGCGKTTLGRIVASQMGCEEGKGLYEYDAATVRGIDTIRSIREASRYTSFHGGSKVYILDEVHQVTGDGQEALLKLLEQPPDHVYLILCTTEPSELKETLRSRCSTYQVQSLQRAKLVKLITEVAKKENIEISSDLVKEIAHCSGGSPRTALVFLDQIADIEDTTMAYNLIHEGVVDDVLVNELCRLLLENRAGKWKDVGKLLTGQNKDVDKIRRGVAGYLSAILLSKENDRIGEILECFMEPLLHSGKAGLIYACYMACKVK